MGQSIRFFKNRLEKKNDTTISFLRHKEEEKEEENTEKL